MKKFFTIMILFLSLASAASGQDRAVGARLSTNVFEASYLGNLSSRVFLEANLGLDDYRDESGFKAELMMNYVVMEPQITSQGSWSVYTGLGLAGGYVYDMSFSTFTYRHPYYGTREQVHDRWGKGPMLGVAVQAGVSYTFDNIPVRLAVDIRPIIGLHRAPTIHPDSDSSRHIGLYGAGILSSYIPKLSVYYLF